ncbi:MAG: hypothetical protein NVS3B10_18370 [Polyangiales bacterium]
MTPPAELVHSPVSIATPRAAPLARSGLWAVLGKHQLAALACTVVDFAVMLGWVRGLHGGIVVATVAGSVVGGALNFALGRRWAFHATASAPGGQAARYVLVALATLALNAAGMALFGVRSAILVARFFVAAIVSVFWNFPMQRWFVFRAPRPVDPRTT